MRNITLLSVLVAAMLLAGCATAPETVQAMADAQARMQVPTITLECAQGCKASYIDPRDRAALKLPTNGWDAAIAIAGAGERLVTGAVLPAATVAIAREIRRAGAGGDVTTTTTTTTTHTASGAGASTGGAGNYEQIGPESQNTTSGDTATTTTTTTDSHDATATPTVVYPVLVTP